MSERCTCANDGNASRCPHHTQKDFDSADRARHAECDHGSVYGYCLVDESGEEKTSNETEALADEVLRALKFGEQVADLLLDDGWISPERLAELIAATRRQALDEAVRAIEVERDYPPRGWNDTDGEWAMFWREGMTTCANIVANLRDGEENDSD